MTKSRLDQLLVERELTESREKAQRLIRAGRVLVNGHPSSKPGVQVPDDADISISETERFVGRGGDKLEAAFDVFDLDARDKVCIDIGASTGGFTDCLLQHGAGKVYAVDVGKGQLHWDLRNDPRVVVMEEINARYLEPDAISEAPALAVFDVSFISLTKVLPAVTHLLAPQADLVTLIKPQFEAGKEHVQKGGVVRNPEIHEQVIRAIRTFGCDELGLTWVDHTVSPLKGPAGNVEFLAHWRKS